MATATSKTLCSTCNQATGAYCCRGCDKDFCMKHLQEHQQVVNGQLDEIINDHDQLKQTIIEQGLNLTSSSLFEQIDQWKQTSIEKITRTAQQYRETVFNQTRNAVSDIQMKLDEFTIQLKHIREENDFNEIDLQRLNKELTEMKEELLKASTISIEEDSQTLINNIHVSLSTSQ